MNLAKPVLLFVLMTLVVLAASTAIRYSVDRNIAAGTWNTVIRNWEQFGLLTLHGRLVDNPGGFEALDKPEVYPGHRATCVYLAFFVKRLFAWTGAGILAFSVAMSLIVFLSTWFLLGKSHAAWLVAAATLLSPGYVLWDAHLDPNAISVLLGLPFALWLISRLSQPRLSATAVTLLFAIILAFTSLNWTTVFVHGVLFGCLLAQRTLPRRRLLLFVALAGLSTLVVAGVSVLGKLSYASASGQSSNLKDFLAAYTLGGTGYGIGMTMAKAMVRLGFVNAMGLLPLLLVLGYVLAKHPRRDGANLWWLHSPFA